MRVALLSDLHISRYGDFVGPIKITDFPRFKIPGTTLGGKYWWQTICEIKEWKIQKNNVDKHLRVLDPNGIRRATKKTGLDELSKQIKVWQCADIENIINKGVTPKKLASLLAIDPQNTNLRLLQIRNELRRLNPEWLIISGDLTDNGYGYHLIDQLLKKWLETGRVFIVPGNHDINKIMPYVGWHQFGLEPGTTERKDKEAKFWEWLATWSKVHEFPQGCSEAVQLGDDIFVLGLDSVRDIGVKFVFEASKNAVGTLSNKTIDRLFSRVEKIRAGGPSAVILVVLHHHLRWKGIGPITIGESAFGLKNSGSVWEKFRHRPIDLIINGHRHMSYYEEGQDRIRLLSNPSSTLGDERNDRSFFIYVLDIDPASINKIKVTKVPLGNSPPHTFPA